MLKESHRALVETNDQLKRELNDLRSKLVLHDGATHLNGNGAPMARAKWSRDLSSGQSGIDRRTTRV